MTSRTQSKAQRRAENQQRAEEKRRAELRRKRTRIGIRVGGVLAVVAIAVVIITQVGGNNSSSGPVPPQDKNPHLALQPVPASMSSTWVQPPAGTTGGEGIPIPNGPKLATLLNAATGQTVDGIQCQTSEGTQVHVHTHLTIFVNGKAQAVPAGIGIPGYPNNESCLYWLHSHYPDGIIHVESPNKSDSYTLGQWFDEWGIPLSSTQVGPAKGNVTVFFTSPGKKTGIFTGNPRNIPLGDHYQIQLEVGTPTVAPVKVTNWAGL